MQINNGFYVEAIRKLLGDNPEASYNEIMSFQIDYYYNNIITKNDQKLIDLAFMPNLTQEQLNAFLHSWDIEVAGSGKALLLSYVMKQHPNLDFGEYTGPRLKGVLNFFRFHNLDLISKYTQIVKELNKENIFPIILKGGAMKYLRPELSRTMGDIDILLADKKQYCKAKKIVTKLNYEYTDNEHSIDLHEPNKENGILDIHLFIDMINKYNHKNFNKKLFANASLQTVFGTKTYLPSLEDMVFIALVNLTKNLREKSSIQGVLYTLFDIHYLISQSSNFNWERLKEHIKNTHTEAQIYIAIKFANKVIPNFLPENLLQEDELRTTVIKLCNRDIFFALYIQNYKVICKKMKIKNHIKSWKDLKYYAKMKIPHFFLKRIYKIQWLIDLFFLKKHSSK